MTGFRAAVTSNHPRRTWPTNLSSSHFKAQKYICSRASFGNSSLVDRTSPYVRGKQLGNLARDREETFALGSSTSASCVPWEVFLTLCVVDDVVQRARERALFPRGVHVEESRPFVTPKFGETFPLVLLGFWGGEQSLLSLWQVPLFPRSTTAHFVSMRAIFHSLFLLPEKKQFRRVDLSSSHRELSKANLRMTQEK